MPGCSAGRIRAGIRQPSGAREDRAGPTIPNPRVSAKPVDASLLAGSATRQPMRPNARAVARPVPADEPVITTHPGTAVRQRTHTRHAVPPPWHDRDTDIHHRDGSDPSARAAPGRVRKTPFLPGKGVENRQWHAGRLCRGRSRGRSKVVRAGMRRNACTNRGLSGLAFLSQAPLGLRLYQGADTRPARKLFVVFLNGYIREMRAGLIRQSDAARLAPKDNPAIRTTRMRISRGTGNWEIYAGSRSM